MFYWLLKHVVLGPVLRLLYRPRVEGARFVPEYGPAILASNHLSFSDSIFLPLVIDRRITFPAKMEYFTAPGLTGWLKKNFFRAAGQIPIDRRGGSASSAALTAGLDVLRRGGLLGIYPEGTRSPDGRLYRGKTGAARLALESGAPLVPVAMIGTDKAQPTGQKVPRLTPVAVRFGAPLDLSRYAGRATDRVALREITDELMAELARLSGQEYVDEYAATRKSQLAARAEELVAAARTETAAARVKAEELVAVARTETAAARVKAEELVASARTESEAAAARAAEFVASARARAEGSAAASKAEGIVAAAREMARGRRDDAPAGGDAPGAEDAPAGGDVPGGDDAPEADGAPSDGGEADGRTERHPPTHA